MSSFGFLDWDSPKNRMRVFFKQPKRHENDAFVFFHSDTIKDIPEGVSLWWSAADRRIVVRGDVA